MHFVKAKSLLNSHNGINIYRGCNHGCIYCDSRSDCYQIKHDFEDIEVKENAPEILEEALRRKRKRCMIGTGSMCDPYMHCEKQLGLTRRCLEIIEKYGFGVTVLTKSDLILRDIDLLQRINMQTKCVVQMTLTTYDEKLCSLIEPGVCTTRRRYEVLKEFSNRGIPTVVWFSPLLPYINDTEENLRGILDLCFYAGVHGIICFGIGVTMRDGNREYFYSALDNHFPGIKERYIRSFGYSYECNSSANDKLMGIFHKECASRGVIHNIGEVFAYLREFPEEGTQLEIL